MTAPSLFISHGAPTLALDDNDCSRFLRGLGSSFARPAAILVLSAHWETGDVQVSTAAHPPTIHDFGNFGEALHRMTYPAPGAPEVAEEAAKYLEASGHTVRRCDRGLDHGAWVPLSLIYPDAGIPVAQISIQPRRDPAHHWAIGEALRPLRDAGVMILGSGSLTHNLGRVDFHNPEGPPPGWVADFADWIADAVSRGDKTALLDYRARAPHAVDNHPTDEHLLPMFAAAGAGGAGQRIFKGTTFGVLAMDIYRFD